MKVALYGTGEANCGIFIGFNATGATRRAETVYHSGAPEFIPSCIVGHESLVFCVVVCLYINVCLFVFILRPLYCLSFDLRLLITLWYL